MKNVCVATVDGFQGGECDAVILSLVRLSKFGSDAKRLNVALTRAKHHLVVLISEQEKNRERKDNNLLDRLMKSFAPSHVFEM